MEVRRRNVGGNMPRKTFNEVLNDTRECAAKNSWARARQASKLRKITTGKTRKFLGRIKIKAINRVIEIVPEQVKIRIDTTYCVGMPSVRWKGHGKLHLPMRNIPQGNI